MSDEILEPRVDQISYGSGKKTFEQSLNYVQVLKKNSDLTRIGGIALGIFGIILVCLRNDPPVETAKDVQGFDVPSVSSQPEDPTKGEYNRAEDARNMDLKNKGRAISRIKLTAPKLITRSVKIKIPPGQPKRLGPLKKGLAK